MRLTACAGGSWDPVMLGTIRGLSRFWQSQQQQPCRYRHIGLGEEYYFALPFSSPLVRVRTRSCSFEYTPPWQRTFLSLAVRVLSFVGLSIPMLWLHIGRETKITRRDTGGRRRRSSPPTLPPFAVLALLRVALFPAEGLHYCTVGMPFPVIVVVLVARISRAARKGSKLEHVKRLLREEEKTSLRSHAMRSRSRLRAVLFRAADLAAVSCRMQRAAADAVQGDVGGSSTKQHMPAVAHSTPATSERSTLLQQKKKNQYRLAAAENEAASVRGRSQAARILGRVTQRRDKTVASGFSSCPWLPPWECVC